MKRAIMVFMAVVIFASCKDEKVTPKGSGISPINPVGMTFEDASGNTYYFNTDNVVINSIAYPLSVNGAGNYVSPGIDSPSFYVSVAGSGSLAIFESDGDVTMVKQM